MYNVHLTHSLLCFEFVEFTLNKVRYALDKGTNDVGILFEETALKWLPVGYARHGRWREGVKARCGLAAPPVLPA